MSTVSPLSALRVFDAILRKITAEKERDCSVAPPGQSAFAQPQQCDLPLCRWRQQSVPLSPSGEPPVLLLSSCCADAPQPAIGWSCPATAGPARAEPAPE